MGHRLCMLRSLPIVVRATAVVLATATCCAPPRSANLAPPDTPPVQSVPASLGDGAWLDLSPAGFEEWLPAVGDLEPQTASTLDQLASLAAGDTRPADALRATLVLATLKDEAAAERLANQLEARHPHAERHADAADTAAAAALASSPFATTLNIGPRLAALAADANPHPDLEVRTECARTALLLGHTEVAAFLLRLTRLGTRLGRDRDGDWHPPVTTTWSRNRAAEALAEFLDIPCPYRGDSSLAQREAAALQLEEAWLAAEK